MADSSERPIFLTGFMGSGKSAVALLLASKLNWEVYDTDRRIEEEAGRSIVEIFQSQGEAEFRRLEKEIVKQAASQECIVVALGGGALQDPETLALVKKSGLLVYLSAAPEILAFRLTDEAKTRPLLKNIPEAERKQKITEMLRDREQIYKQADFEVSTDQHSPSWVADQIFRRWMRV